MFKVKDRTCSIILNIKKFAFVATLIVSLSFATLNLIVIFIVVHC